MRSLVVVAAVACAACPRAPSTEAEELVVDGALERDGVSDSAVMDEVAIDYRSTGARGEWWPCDLRLTAGGCVDDKHVNVYVTLPEVADTDGIGTAACVVDGEPYGVYEVLQEKQQVALGSELQAYVVVASDTKGDPGALLDDDEETAAASRIASGTLEVLRSTDQGAAVSLLIEGATSGDRPVRVAFGGPIAQPAVVPPLEGPSTCVDGALVTE